MSLTRGLQIVISKKELTSERDQVFLLKDHIEQQFVLKVANPEEKRQVLEFQNDALSTIEQKAPWPPSPRVVASIDQIKRGLVHNLDLALKSFG